jgi:probable F420-dependent oxidoreductase
MREIKFGLYLPTGDFARARRVAERAEQQGFYSLSINDHLYSPMGERDPQLECFSTLSAIAAITTRVRLAPAVVAMSFRNPALLAKTASTLDCISNGRLIMGLGSGWQRTEYDAHGYPYPSSAERLDQLEDGINVLKAMWTQEEPAWKGRYFSVRNAYNHPRPVQKPYPPIMIGGSGKRLLQIAAKHADIALLTPPIYHDKDSVQDPTSAVNFTKAVLKRRIAQLKTLAEEAGRDPDSIELASLVFATIARDKDRADAAVRQNAARMGFPSEDAVRNSPGLLMGTAEEVKRELRSRIDDFGLTFFTAAHFGQESYEIFVKEIMPEFAG